MLGKYTETLCTVQKKTSLESSLLQDIPTLNWQDSSQLEDWLTDIEIASELTGESRTKIAHYVGQYGGRELEISHRFYLSF